MGKNNPAHKLTKIQHFLLFTCWTLRGHFQLDRMPVLIFHAIFAIFQPEVSHPFSVSVYKDLVYWDDWKSLSIYMANKDSGKGVLPVEDNITYAMGIKVSPLLKTSNIPLIFIEFQGRINTAQTKPLKFLIESRKRSIHRSF